MKQPLVIRNYTCVSNNESNFQHHLVENDHAEYLQYSTITTNYAETLDKTLLDNIWHAKMKEVSEVDWMYPEYPI